jgi:hypothetical protein
VIVVDALIFEPDNPYLYERGGNGNCGGHINVEKFISDKKQNNGEKIK